MLVEALLLWIGLSAIVVAAAVDVRFRIIPNVVVLGIAGAGLGLRVLADGWASWESLVIAIATFLPLGLLAGQNRIGGGDAKMIAVVTLLVEPGSVPREFLAIALAGGVLAMIYLAGERWTARLGASVRTDGVRTAGGHAPQNAPPVRPPVSLPYGVAIGAGAVFVLLRGGAGCSFGTFC